VGHDQRADFRCADRHRGRGRLLLPRPAAPGRRRAGRPAAHPRPAARHRGGHGGRAGWTRAVPAGGHPGPDRRGRGGDLGRDRRPAPRAPPPCCAGSTAWSSTTPAGIPRSPLAPAVATTPRTTRRRPP